MKKTFYNSGQTIVESLIALSLLVVILTAISVVVLTSLNNSSYIKQQNQANKLAQQGMEYVRGQMADNLIAADSGGGSIYSEQNQGSRCLTASNTLSYTPCDTTSPTSSDLIFESFKREVKFTPTNCDGSFTNGVLVTVTVAWTSGKCTVGNSYCNQQSVKSCFLDPAKAFPTAVPTTYQGI